MEDMSAKTNTDGASASQAAPFLSYEEFTKLTSAGKAPKMQKDPFGIDFSTFNTDSAQLIRECKGNVYGYVRVSTEHQDYARQLDVMEKLGVRQENIFKDKKSGKDFDREGYTALMNLIQPGDLVVVLSLDRFGRNISEIKDQWCWITQHRRTNIVVIDQPILNAKLGMHGLGNFIADLILAVFSLMAEMERGFINKRMGDGIKRAKLEGKKLGRKPLSVPGQFWQLKELFLGGGISQNMAAKELDVDSHTFRKWVSRTGSAACASEWEILLAELERKEKADRIEKARVEYGELKGRGENMAKKEMAE